MVEVGLILIEELVEPTDQEYVFAVAPVKVVLCPLQIFVFPLMVNVGLGTTFTTIELEPVVQPVELVTCTT